MTKGAGQCLEAKVNMKHPKYQGRFTEKGKSKRNLRIYIYKTIDKNDV